MSATKRNSPSTSAPAGEKPVANARQEGGSHYQGAYTQQHWDYTWERGFNQFQYAITKYVERYKKKNGLQDLLKAKHYLEKLIELEYPDYKGE